MIRNIQRRLVTLATTAAMCCLALGASAQQVLFEDAYNLKDGERPPRWKIIGNTSLDYWFTQGGRLNSGPGNNYTLGPSFFIVQSADASGWTDYTVSAKATPLDADQDGSISLVARFSDTNNYYVASLVAINGGAGIPVERVVEILKVVKGVESPVASESPVSLPAFDTPNSGPFTLEFSVSGPNLSLRLNGTEVVRGTDNNLRNGSAGVGMNLSQALFEDFRVTAGGPPAPANTGSGPSATSGSGATDWRILVVEGITETDARARIEEMQGMRDTMMRADGNGMYSVYVGLFSTKEEAQRRADELIRDEGFVLDGPRQVPRDASAPAAAGSARGIRVKVDTYNSQTEADGVKSRLTLGGFYPLDVFNEGGRYVLYAGPVFAAQAEAQTLAASIRDLGFANVSVASNAQGPGSTAAPSLTQIQEEARRAGIAAGSADLQRIADLIKKQEEAFKQGNTAAQIQAIQQAKDDTFNRQLRDENLRREQERERIRDLETRLESALSDKRWTEVESLIRDTRALDPTNPLVRIAQNQLNASRSGAPASGPGTAPGGTPPPAVVTPATPAEGGGGSMLIIILSVVGVVVIGVIGYFVVALKKGGGTPAPKPASSKGSSKSGSGSKSGSLSGLPTGPSMSGGMGSMYAGGNTPASAPQQKPAAQHRPAASPIPDTAPDPGGVNLPVVSTAPPMAGRPDDRIRPGALSPSPGASPDVVAIPGMVLNAQVPTPPSSASVQQPDFNPRGNTTPLPVSSMPGDPPSSRPGIDTSAFNQDPSSAMRPQSSGGTPVPLAAPATGFPVGVHYEQTFDDEQIGAAPRSWKGKYDFASLSIVEAGAGKSGKALRFEKKVGTGTAYYSCRFADASGRICAEFDIRCDDKNRYLIGFYIEKDEDFRQSIQTVVHRKEPGSPTTLRLQNESCDYEFGKWVHVRFIIDLPRSVVDGWVDEQPVATGVRLQQAPKVLNTLSIRDNSATTGVLLLDNIKVYRVP